MSYAWSELQLALRCLTEEGSKRERLGAAVAKHLVCLRPKDLPSECRPEFTFMIDRLRFASVRKRDASIKQLIETLREEEVDALIGAILHLYDAVTRYQPIQSTVEVASSTTSLLPLGKDSANDFRLRNTIISKETSK